VIPVTVGIEDDIWGFFKMIPDIVLYFFYRNRAQEGITHEHVVQSLTYKNIGGIIVQLKEGEHTSSLSNSLYVHENHVQESDTA
jgi:hypothetical protein